MSNPPSNPVSVDRARPWAFALIVLLLGACNPHPREKESMKFVSDRSWRVLATSESGDRMSEQENITFRAGSRPGTKVVIRPRIQRQEIHGIGTSFTESSAFVLAHLTVEKRRELMELFFGQGEGSAGFSLCRTHIGSCDFSVEGRYDYQADEKAPFDIAVDRAGFPDEEKYPHVRDRRYDLLPMIQEGLALNPEIRLVASAWTAPPWMKDLGEYFRQGHLGEDGRWVEGTGGRLLDEHYPTFARYLRRYVDAYRQEGVPIWALTPVNEPLGNAGQWESMHFSAAEEAVFVRDHMAPALTGTGVAILPYDQNRGAELEEWGKVFYADADLKSKILGLAVHWYSSTIDARTASLDHVHDLAPDRTIVHTEGCIDALGTPAPAQATDPEGYQEKGWWLNDRFWWNDNATDWAYTTPWGDPADHPKYTPVHRYARNIIDSLNHWVSGWIDWNIVLDRRGGPNHVGNFCGAPVMIDTGAENPDEAIHLTPVFYTLAQFSRTIRPGDRVVESEILGEGALGGDDLHALATLSPEGRLSVHLLNTTKKPLAFSLEIDGRSAPVTMDANAIWTIQMDRQKKRLRGGPRPDQNL